MMPSTSVAVSQRSGRSAWWIAGNIVAILLYLYLSSRTWLEPEFRGEDVATGGDAVVWALSALPVFVVAVVANLAVVVWGAVYRRRHGQWPFTSRSWAIVAAWFAAYVIDVYHH